MIQDITPHTDLPHMQNSKSKIFNKLAEYFFFRFISHLLNEEKHSKTSKGTLSKP